MELNHLKHFFEVAKSGSFAKASQRLRISQSALSKAVQLLESSGKSKLFIRSKAGVALTPIGLDIFAKCERLFETFNEIEATCLQKAEVYEGPLRIGGSDHVTKYLFVPALRELKLQYPAILPIAFASGPNEIASAILNGEIECGLFFTKVANPMLRYEEFSKHQMTVVCHPDLAPKSQSLMTPGELKKAARTAGLITSTSNRYSYNPSGFALQQLGDPPVNFEINSQEAQKEMCLAGGGLCVLAKFVVEKELQTKQLVELKIRNPLSLTLYLATKKSRAHSRNAEAFLTLLRLNEKN